MEHYTDNRVWSEEDKAWVFPIKESHSNVIVWSEEDRKNYHSIIPSILFDGHSVYQAMTDHARRRTSPENVSDVLDAVVKILRSK